MGDRALIQLFSSNTPDEPSPVLYLHWGGSDVGDILRKAQAQMKGRANDVSYAFARLVQCATAGDEGNTGFGVFDQVGFLSANDSHGDAGCFVVDVVADEWTVYVGGGYAFGYEDDPDNRRIMERELKVLLLDRLEEQPFHRAPTSFALADLFDTLNTKLGGTLYGQNWKDVEGRRHELAVLIADALDVLSVEHEDDDVQARRQSAADRLSVILREALPAPTDE